jgi:hypothetical protein
MKLPIFRSLTVIACSIGLTSYVVAGPAQQSQQSGGQGDSDNHGLPVMMPTNHSGPAFNAGGQGNQSSGSTGDSASSTGNGSSSGSNSSSGTASSSDNSSSNSGNLANNSGHQSGQFGRANGSNPFVNGSTANVDFNSKAGRGEQMVTVPDQTGQRNESVQKGEQSEVSKKFEPSLLDTGLAHNSNDNSNVQESVVEKVNEQKGSHDSVDTQVEEQKGHTDLNQGESSTPNQSDVEEQTGEH